MTQQLPNNKFTIKELYFTIKEWLGYLLSKWIIILVVGLAGGCLGLAYAFNEKPVYTANLTFALEDQQQSGGLSGALGLASQLGINLGGSGGGMFVGANLIELFKSRTIIEKTLLTPVIINGKTTTFAEMYIDNMEWRKRWVKKPALKNIQFLSNSDRQQFNRAQDSILGVIYGGISKNSLRVFQKDNKIAIITIVMQSEDEDFAKNFTETLVKEVSDFYILSKSKRASLNMSILERQIDSIRGELNSAITGVALANDNTFGLNPALNVRKTPSAKRQVDVQANMAILTELVKQAEVAKVTLRNSTPLIQVIDRPILPLKKEKFGKLKGIIIGGLLAGMLIVIFLIIKRAFKQLVS